jgi:hypothetical protein
VPRSPEQRRRATSREATPPAAHVLETEAAIRAHAEEPAQHDTLGLLKGAQAIADFIDEPVRNTYAWLEGGRLDAFKLGGIWATTKSRLVAQFAAIPRYVPPQNGNGRAEPESAPPRRPIRSRPAENTEDAPRPLGGRATRGAARAQQANPAENGDE